MLSKEGAFSIFSLSLSSPISRLTQLSTEYAGDLHISLTQGDEKISIFKAKMAPYRKEEGRKEEMKITENSLKKRPIKIYENRERRVK